MPICTGCNQDKLELEFYKRSNSQLYKKCKTCSNTQRHQYYKPHKRENGYEKLDNLTKMQIQEDYATKMCLKAIANKHKINYSTFFSWIQRNIITF